MSSSDDFESVLRTNNHCVTHVLYSGLGGHSAVLFALLEGGFMSNAHHHVLFVGVESPPAEYLRRCEELHISHRYLPKEDGKGHFSFLMALIRDLVASESDMLFLHGLAAMPAVALLKLFRRRRKPFVLVRETQANHLKTQRDWISLVLAHVFADRIVHLTDEANKGAAQRLKGWVRQAKVAVVANGLDTDFYSPAPPDGVEAGVIRIGMQSRLQPNKDHSTLIGAFALLCKRHPDRHFHLHIAGDGSTYSDIEIMIHQLGLSGVTTLHGMLDQTELRDFLRGLDIYVHATHGETMSTAIMQALSCGLPVIASDVAGVSNMVRPEAGQLYRPGDPSDLASKLDGLVCSTFEVSGWRERARRYAVAHYGIAATVRSYEALLPSFDAPDRPHAKVVHLIPYDGIGGVEVAAKSLPGGIHNDVEFHKYFIADKAGVEPSAFQHCGLQGSVNDPRNFIRAICWVVKSRPKLVIASLWRSCVVLILLKLVRPRTKTVVFLHLAKDVHFLDKVFNHIAMVLATEIWTDSEATRQARVPKRLQSRSRVISFMVEPVAAQPIAMVQPKFIFWGRLQAQKGLDQALELFAQIKLEFPTATFVLIGPDGGQRSDLLKQIDRLGLGSAVEFHGPMSRSQITQLAAEHSFYLQTSVMEGMAMSVVEAMQFGLVPVVTPVGEIAHYCCDGESAIFVSDIQQTALRVGELLENPAAFSLMASAAQATWQGKRLYRDDVLAACSDILRRES